MELAGTVGVSGVVAEPREGQELVQGEPTQSWPFPEHLLWIWLVLADVTSWVPGRPWGSPDRQASLSCVKHAQGSEYRRLQVCMAPLPTSSPYQARARMWAQRQTEVGELTSSQ